MRLLTFSECSLRKSGQRWVRLGWHGPGLRCIDTRSPLHPFQFSFRHGLQRCLRLGPYALVWLPRTGNWPRSPG